MNLACLQKFTSDFVIRLMPEANKTYIKQYWPVVYMALDEYGLDYEEMVLMALGTIAAETGNFNIAIREYVSQYNTSPNGRMMGHSFDLYDHRGTTWATRVSQTASATVGEAPFSLPEDITSEK